MKTSLTHLPQEKQEELALIKEIILSNAPVEMIILFGSYSTDRWVEDRVRHEVPRRKYSHSEIGSRLYPIANRAVRG